MKKTIKLLIISLIMTTAFVYNDNVYAEVDCNKYACAKCVYEDEYAKYTYDITSTNEGKLDINFSFQEKNSEITNYKITNNINSDNFFVDTNTNQIKCPTIYQDKYGVIGQENISLTTGNGNPLSATPESTNNDKIITIIDNGNVSNGGGHRHDDQISCTYTGKMSGKTLKITESSDGSEWNIIHPDGTNETVKSSQVGSNILPSSSCEDIFYIYDASDKVRAIDASSNYYKNYIATYCNKYENVEQFCSGNCNIVNPLCGSNDGDIDSGNCPDELRPIIVFVKKVAVNSLQIIVPILLILMGTIDMTKAVISNDEKGIKDATSKLIKRVLAAVLFFFVTTIVNIVIGRIAVAGIDGTDNWQSCWYNID